MTTKYSAKHVFWDSQMQIVRSIHDIEIYRCNGKLKLPPHYYRFDSQYEFKVYLELCRMYGEHRVKRQVAVEIIPPCSCYPSGKTWKIDFAIASKINPKQHNFYVEAKGLFVPSFADILACFEINNIFEFSNLYIVFGKEIPKDKRAIRNLIKANKGSNLLTLNGLKQLTYLP